MFSAVAAIATTAASSEVRLTRGAEMTVLIGGKSVHLHDIAGANDPLARVYAIKMPQRKLQTSARWVRFAHGDGLRCHSTESVWPLACAGRAAPVRFDRGDGDHVSGDRNQG